MPGDPNNALAALLRLMPAFAGCLQGPHIILSLTIFKKLQRLDSDNKLSLNKPSPLYLGREYESAQLNGSGSYKLPAGTFLALLGNDWNSTRNSPLQSNYSANEPLFSALS